MSGKKGIVMEKGEGWVIVLLDNGEYNKFYTRENWEVGQLYRRKTPVKILAVAAVFLLVFLATLDFFTVLTYARLSTGVELGFNRWDRVVKITAQDENAKAIVAGLNLKGATAETAVAEVLKKSLNDNKGLRDSQAATYSLEMKGKVQDEDRDRLWQKMDRGVNKAIKQQKGQEYSWKVVGKNKKMLVPQTKALPVKSRGFTSETPQTESRARAIIENNGQAKSEAKGRMKSGFEAKAKNELKKDEIMDEIKDETKDRGNKPEEIKYSEPEKREEGVPSFTDKDKNIKPEGTTESGFNKNNSANSEGTEIKDKNKAEKKIENKDKEKDKNKDKAKDEAKDKDKDKKEDKYRGRNQELKSPGMNTPDSNSSGKNKIERP
ncbi:anti-sigma-I factor RsgI family protein [Syntrophomonas wolfei]|uniref:RsgI N-terminal anti-sigma domain-containing protein n=1 Tax=Syntrophomonas wolfei subsp. wolfei (strain DSM 2245B / Goettingen) TaxID=335541 RepID=Q0AYE4_SYNWW|nr:hypothetical protein [Syntrophomonas wolfei]ABI68260.1 hypothetical protein Swol_0945 [Syntrophomonas wolfei subsp. wolfei str. Goettingen G311]